MFRKDNPCKEISPCAAAYVFKNNLPLSNKLDNFTNTIRQTKTNSGNIDSLEANLEALLQVMVCTDTIKWGKDSVHLIILITDGGFHIAGDGKLAGIIKPNDGQCHTSIETNEYTHGLLQDYPSIGQINRIAFDNKMQIIFAVPEEKKKLYRYDILEKNIRTSNAEILSGDSSNIIDLIDKYYQVSTFIMQ